MIRRLVDLWLTFRRWPGAVIAELRQARLTDELLASQTALDEAAWENEVRRRRARQACDLLDDPIPPRKGAQP